VVIATGITIATTNSKVGAAIGSGTANAIPSPTGVTAGDLLIAIVGFESSIALPSASTGWTTILSAVGSNNLIITFGRVADGSANDSLSIGASGDPTQGYCAAILRITGHSVTSGTITSIPKTQGSGTSATPDPQAIGSLASATRLWLAIVNVDRSAALETITAVPSSYTSVVNLVSSATAASSALGVARRTLTGTSEDPGVFTASASRPWTALTLAIPQ